MNRGNNMIYITGDIHGELEVAKVVEYFDNEMLTTQLTKDDYLIILGDVGVCWDCGDKDAYVKRTLSGLPVTTLWIDGNHENFDLIEDYPVEKWHGGKVHFIEDDIIHLMRGQVFEIEGKTFLTMGGAYSIDKLRRREGIDWWPEEIPTNEELKEGIQNVNKYDCCIDYVLTHTAPYEVLAAMNYDVIEEEEEFVHGLQLFVDHLDFQEWFFGHLHEDEDLENFHAVYDRFIKIQ